MAVSGFARSFKSGSAGAKSGVSRPADLNARVKTGAKSGGHGAGRAAPDDRLLLAFPERDLLLEQDSEWFVLRTEAGWRQIRFHDYAQIYQIPGLYEHLFYEVLKCESPAVIRRELEIQLRRADVAPATLRVLDFGAGNGMVGEQLADLGAQMIVGADILTAAAEAARRDRPGLYQDYYIRDFTALDENARRSLLACELNCLTCVAALGFGDIPTEAFTTAYNLIENGGWVAFNIKEDFLADPAASPFATLIEAMIGNGTLQVLSRTRYCHRLSTAHQPLHYVAFVGRKTQAIPGTAHSG